MIYRAGWIEKNMGVSRKALRVYEAKGLIRPRINARNNKYREYTEEDLVDIWNIRTLRELGVSLSDIKGVLDDSSKLKEVMDMRIEELTMEARRALDNLQIAKSIREIGVLPVPPSIGTMRHGEYLQILIEERTEADG